MYEREDWALFRTLNTLGQKAGVQQFLIPGVVAKELVDNALDEGGTCRVGLLDENGFWVEDDGKGIVGCDDEIADLFSIGRPLRSSKLLRKPTRGALGNGLRVVTGAVLASGGSLVVRTRGRALRLTPKDDGTTVAEPVGEFDGPGTRIEVRLGPALPVTERALVWPREAIALAGVGSCYTGRTSPHWFDSESFFELLQAAGKRTVREVVEDFEGCSGPKAGRIAAQFKGRLASELTRKDAERLLMLAKSNAKVVKPERLRSLGPVVPGWPTSHFKITGTYLAKAARGAQQAEIPFVLKTYAEISDMAIVQVAVNRTPITGFVHAYHDKDDLLVMGCGLITSFKVGRRPIRLCLNIDTPHMPITSDGKAPDLCPFVSSIKLALDKVIKKAKRSMPANRLAKRLTTKDIILEYLEESIDKASGSGKYRFSIRQLFYAVRPHVLDAMEKEPEYDYFSRIITDYESVVGEIEGMYRDPRGTVYHPHTGQEIQLGTMQVEQYCRPDFTFNKILYCEKEGIFPVLKDARWPERHDCALMTSKGFASRAARDLIDLLGESGEDLQVFCIHDADAAGTLIYQSLQEGTRARGGRKVQIINLGLEPEEALRMRLQVENVKRDKDKRQPVADYVPEEWQEWLQAKRVELNAMPTPQLLSWLDNKMEEYAGKVVPPKEVLADRLEQGIRIHLQETITEETLRQANIAERVEREFGKREAVFRFSRETIEQDVRDALDKQPASHWTRPVAEVAQEIVQSVPFDPGYGFAS
jgi:hypothetical protein